MLGRQRCKETNERIGRFCPLSNLRNGEKKEKLESEGPSRTALEESLTLHCDCAEVA